MKPGVARRMARRAENGFKNDAKRLSSLIYICQRSRLLKDLAAAQLRVLESSGNPTWWKSNPLLTYEDKVFVRASLLHWSGFPNWKFYQPEHEAWLKKQKKPPRSRNPNLSRATHPIEPKTPAEKQRAEVLRRFDLREAFDGKTGNNYFFDVGSSEATWELPEEVELALLHEANRAAP